MGLILERSGMAEELLDTAGKLFGPIRGGVAYAVICVGALLAATTGVVAASVIAMGLISLPIMLRYGYDRRVATGVIAASGTLAQIIPPSLVLIIMADQLGRSVGDIYKGAIIPGLVLTGLYMVYVFLTTMIFPKSAPALPAEARSFGEGAEYGPVLAAILLPISLVFWGMVLLFHPPLALEIMQGLVPPAAAWLGARSRAKARACSPCSPASPSSISSISGCSATCRASLRRLPASCSWSAALFVLWQGVAALIEGAQALPPIAERGLSWALDAFLWIAAEWAYAHRGPRACRRGLFARPRAFQADLGRGLEDRRATSCRRSS